MEPHAQPLALDHLRVLELPGLPGAYCGKLLADLGADVIKIEPPGGDPMRFTGPFAGDTPDPERSLPFLNFHTNKRSAVLDLESEEGRATLRALVPTVDVIIESYVPGFLDARGLGFDALHALNPRLVLASITAFGQTGIYSGFQGADIVGAAMGGQMTNQGDPDFPPCTLPFDQTSQLSSLHAAFALLFALHRRAATGRGDHVDVSLQEVMAHMNFPISRYDRDATITPRPGAAPTAFGVDAFPSQNGWIHLYPRRRERLEEWMNMPEFSDPRWQDREYQRQHASEAWDLISRFTTSLTRQELIVEGQRRGISVAPVNTVADFVNDGHVQHRGYFQQTEHPILGHVTVPGAPYRLSETPVRLRLPAPSLGQHTTEVLAEAAAPRQRVEVRERSVPASAAAGMERQPLKGLRVLDFTIAYAGPFGTRYLAELGAEIIKVESRGADPSMQNPTIRTDGAALTGQMEINRSKRSITLDLHLPQAQELTRRIAGISDFMISNFRPGTMGRWNLGYEDICAVKPDIIFAEMPGFGNSGPFGAYSSQGQTLMSYNGTLGLWGHPGSPPNKHGKVPYPDWVGAANVCVALLAALNYRERTGKGQYIEVAQFEAASAMLGVAYLDYFVNSRVAEAAGNRHPTFAPYNVYPCRGDDRWVSIAVTTDEQWAGLVRALGAPDWAADEGLATVAGRKAREAAIDRGLAEWTRQYTPHQVMRLLQRAGVPAGAVQNNEDLWYDPHLRERGYTTVVDQPVFGPGLESGVTVRFREAPRVQPRGVPRLGEANEYVFGELLGMSTAEIRALEDARVLY